MPTPILFICTMLTGQFYNYDIYSEEEFNRTIERYNRECGGVGWAKLINKKTGKIIQSYKAVQNSVQFVTEDE